jgi:hypothetical protein
MAEIELRPERFPDGDPWPAVCARCSEPAELRVPVPAAFNKGPAELAVPVCERHLGHWETFRSRNRIVLVVVLLFLAGGPFLLWHLLAPQPGGPAPPVVDRVMTVAGWTGAGAVLLILPLAAWVGTGPVRVVAGDGDRLILKGVASKFARLFAERERLASALPELAPEARLDVQPYRPDGVCPWPGTVQLLLCPPALGAGLGALLGLAARYLAGVAHNWPREDWRYLGLIAAVCAAYAAVAAVPLLRSPSALRLRVGGVLLLLVLAMVGCAGVLRWFAAVPFPVLLGLVLYCPALLVLLVVTWYLVRLNRVRHTVAAGVAGFLAPAALVGAALLVTGGWDGRDNLLPVIGLLAALGTAVVAGAAAREPFCTLCDSWMGKRPLGALGRPCAEVKPLLSAGEVIRLAGEPVLPEARAGDVELSMYFCPNCRESGRVVLELTDLFKTPKGATQRRTAGRWVYPGIALVVVEKMFPPPVPAPQIPPEE